MKNLVIKAKSDSLNSGADFYWTVIGLADELYDKVMRNVAIEGDTLIIPAP